MKSNYGIDRTGLKQNKLHSSLKKGKEKHLRQTADIRIKSEDRE